MEEQAEEGDPTHLLSPCEATYAVLCLVLGSSVQVEHGDPGAGPSKGYKNDSLS